MIRIFSHDGKKVNKKELDYFGNTNLGEKRKDHVWIAVNNATKSDAEILKKKFNIHPTTLEDMFSQNSRIKYEELDEYTLIVFKAIKKIGSLYVKTDNIAMVFGESILITVSTNGNQTIENLITNERKLETLLAKGEDFICHYVLDKEIDKYVETKNILGEDFKKLEREFLKKPGKDILSKLFTKELILLELRQTIESTTDMALNLIKPTDNYIHNELLPYFRDVYDHAFKTTDSLKTILGRINGMRNSYQSIISNRMNETIRTLTILMAIMLPMTVITGFYGMNVHLPLQNNVNAPALIAGLMILTSIIIYFASRGLGWIKQTEKLPYS